MRREAGSPKILIIPELRVLVLTKRHVGSGNEIDDAIESDLPASLRQEDVRLVFKVFFRYLGYFCEII